ncbi:hypothetical protein P280DRAFT_484581 [Massarina eburnea CBS 473.64]|uniref:Uncharacterized protein n=1 Tax=Massarina eburnea CBS 473.64 TaxID=1395130 RepID=A0A6A6RJL7_9PLEO|nr:hypothetical protein P280DRAFT_484581 [Massarina eburnea CBS 473.64]
MASAPQALPTPLPSPSSATEFNVVVTASIPSGERPPTNAAELIAKALPRIIFRHTINEPNIRIFLAWFTLPSSYADLATYLPHLIGGNPGTYGLQLTRKVPVHGIVHLGIVDSPGQGFTLMKKAIKPDLGENSEDREYEWDYCNQQRTTRIGGVGWERLPRMLETCVDLKRVVRIAKDMQPTIKNVNIDVVDTVKPTYPPYHVYYASLNAYSCSVRKISMFMYTPMEDSSANIKVGVDVVTAAIEAYVNDLTLSGEGGF